MNKELEKIKWDYWNKSKPFKLLWQYYRAKKLDPATPFPDKFKEDHLKYAECWKRSFFIGNEVAWRAFYGEKEPNTHAVFVAAREYWLYWINHEPETASFDDYWNFKEEVRRAFAGDTPTNKYVEDYSGLIARDIESVVDTFKRKENRKPTIDELKEYLTNSLMPSSSLTLKIHQWKFTDKEAKIILKEVSRILKDRTYRIKPEPKALKQYLRAWEYKHEQNKSYSEIFNKLIKEKDYNLIDEKRKPKLYVANARKIIKNLETNKKI